MKENTLPVGAVIVDKYGRKIKIEKIISRGGTSIIYEVSNEDTKRQLILKECCPRDERFSRQNGVIRPVNPNDEKAKTYLAEIKKIMLNEGEIGQQIAQTSRRIIASWENLNPQKIIIDEEIFDAADSFFILMEKAPQGYFLQEFLAEIGTLTPYVTVCIIEQLLESLSYIHRAGYIHGDIQENNFLLVETNPKRGEVGYGQLLDLGNVRKILPDGKTAILDGPIFSTPGYWSPEILTGNPKTLRLSQATDIYSVGALMLYLIKGFSFKSTLGNKMALRNYVSAPVTESQAIARGYRRKAVSFVGKILLKALKQNPLERYQNAAEMLADIRKLKQMVKPPEFALSPNLSITPEYIAGSRAAEILQLHQNFSTRNPLFIWGLAGIGKSTLALAFAKEIAKSGVDAYFVTFRGSIKETVLSLNFSGYECTKKSQEEEYVERLNILRENYAGSLLIVDNFDKPDTDIAELQQELAYQELIALDMHIIFTTRARPDRTTPELPPLSPDNALKLFKNITKDTAAESKPAVLELLQEISYHPLTVSLAAHAVAESWNNITAEILLDKLKTGNFSGANKIYEQIKILLNLFDLEEYRDLLCHTTLLPLDGFDAGIFIDCENPKKKDSSKSWKAQVGFDAATTIN